MTLERLGVPDIKTVMAYRPRCQHWAAVDPVPFPIATLVRDMGLRCSRCGPKKFDAQQNLMEKKERLWP